MLHSNYGEQILDQIGGITCSDTSIWRRVKKWEKIQVLEEVWRAAASALPQRGGITRGEICQQRDMGAAMEGVKVNLREEGWKELKVGCVCNRNATRERS